MKTILLSLTIAAVSYGADAATIEKGRAEEKRACAGCHGLRIIQIQRLGKGAWDRELTKMTGWGATIKERDALMEYLLANYGDDRPAAPLERTGNGVKK